METMFPGLWNLPVEFVFAVDGVLISDWKLDRLRQRFNKPALSASSWAVRLSKRFVFREFLQSEEEALLFMEDDCLFFPGFEEDVELLLREMPDGWDVAFLGGRDDFDLPEGAAVPGVYPFPGTTWNHCLLVSRAGARKLIRLLRRPVYHENSDEEIRLAIERGELSAWWTERYTTAQRSGVSDNGQFRERRLALPDHGMMAGQDDQWLLRAATPYGGVVLEWGSGGSTCHLADGVGPEGRVVSFEHNVDFYRQTIEYIEPNCDDGDSRRLWAGQTVQ
ncbi:MAG: hypothetical protein R3F19_09980 [Verrucomicrobiales bacterium]